MKYFVKISVLLLLVVLAFCACDNSNENGKLFSPIHSHRNLSSIILAK